MDVIARLERMEAELVEQIERVETNAPNEQVVLDRLRNMLALHRESLAAAIANARDAVRDGLPS